MARIYLSIMFGFRKGWRSFKAGLSKQDFREYWKATWPRAWEIFWGAGLLGVVCTVVTLYYSPSFRAMGWAVAWVFLVAGYFAWRPYYLRLRPKLEIGGVNSQPWKADEGNAIAYNFSVVNISEGSTIYGVQVYLAEITPEVQNLNWLPVLLKQKHNNPPTGTTPDRDFVLNPGEINLIDFVAALQGDRGFMVQHIAGPGINQGVPSQMLIHHELKILVTAIDTPPLYAWFDVWINEIALLQCKLIRQFSGEADPAVKCGSVSNARR